jgi:DNA-binding MarR family transcriptional regulator
MDMLIAQQLLERLAGLLRSESRKLLFEYGLQPVQFEALHYLSICNRYSDTPMAVTEYLGQTKGSVSQTLKVLEKKGFINKASDSSDKRVIHLAITVEGREIVAAILPSPILRLACDQLNKCEVSTINSSLAALLTATQKANGFKSFGQCASCRHNIKLDSGESFCGLTNEPLSTMDTELICCEHEPGKLRQEQS